MKEMIELKLYMYLFYMNSGKGCFEMPGMYRKSNNAWDVQKI